MWGRGQGPRLAFSQAGARPGLENWKTYKKARVRAKWPPVAKADIPSGTRRVPQKAPPPRPTAQGRSRTLIVPRARAGAPPPPLPYAGEIAHHPGVGVGRQCPPPGGFSLKCKSWNGPNRIVIEQRPADLKVESSDLCWAEIGGQWWGSGRNMARQALNRPWSEAN